MTEQPQPGMAFWGLFDGCGGGGTALLFPGFLQFSMGISCSGSPANRALISNRAMTNLATKYRHPSAYRLGASRKAAQF